MQTINATEFKARCLELLDNVPEEGLAITKRGRRVAVVFPALKGVVRLYGSLPGMVVDGDITTTGVKWNAES